jgi:hypothetical protein
MKLPSCSARSPDPVELDNSIAPGQACGLRSSLSDHPVGYLIVRCLLNALMMLARREVSKDASSCSAARASDPSLVSKSALFIAARHRASLPGNPYGPSPASASRCLAGRDGRSAIPAAPASRCRAAVVCETWNRSAARRSCHRACESECVRRRKAKRPRSGRSAAPATAEARLGALISLAQRGIVVLNLICSYLSDECHGSSGSAQRCSFCEKH